MGGWGLAYVEGGEEVGVRLEGEAQSSGVSVGGGTRGVRWGVRGGGVELCVGGVRVVRGDGVRVGYVRGGGGCGGIRGGRGVGGYESAGCLCVGGMCDEGGVGFVGVSEGGWGVRGGGGGVKGGWWCGGFEGRVRRGRRQNYVKCDVRVRFVKSADPKKSNVLWHSGRKSNK